MSKFIYTYTFSSEFETGRSVTITFESPSKEDLVTGLGCSLIDFKNKVYKIRKELNLLDEQKTIALRGSHKKQPSMQEYARLSDLYSQLSKEMNCFTYEGRTYRYEDFVESSYNCDDEVINLEYHIQSIEEYFEEHLATQA